MAESYYDLLRRPEWQRKRLEVMQAADFVCQECGAKDKTLNVHHRWYERGKKPWEYPDYALRCLCEDCHATVTQMIHYIRQHLGALPSKRLQGLTDFIDCAISGATLPRNTIIVNVGEEIVYPQPECDIPE